MGDRLIEVGYAPCLACRDLYLGESLQRLCRPVDQMFPQVEGYQSAIPSKHDLQSFVKVGSELEGDDCLLPYLLLDRDRGGDVI